MNLFIDVISCHQKGITKPYDAARSLGIKWAVSESQPMAEQIKLIGCTVPDELTEANWPDWLRRGTR